MILSDQDIVKYLEAGKIQISPQPDLTEQLGSCSIDFRLSNVFRVFEHSKHPAIDLQAEFDLANLMRKVVIPEGEAFTIQPGDFVLAATVETLEIPDDIMARLGKNRYYCS